MYKVIVFAGTTEGYGLCRFLSGHGIPVYACVATDYGTRSLEENEYLKVQAGRLDAEEMEALFRELRPEIVLDATHPYAAEVTANIRTACSRADAACQRVLRDGGALSEKAVCVEDTSAAIEYLKGTKGNILLTTGSKELASYTAIPDYRERLFARVLSLPSVLETCRTYGLEGKHLIGMQGPFSRELNAAMLRQYDCRYLVTKDTGKAGGFQEKIDAALECGAVPVIIGRPSGDAGISVQDCRKLLIRKFGIVTVPRVTLLGIGMGSRDTLTVEGTKVLEEAELLIGAQRMVEAVRLPHHLTYCEYRSEKIHQYIKEHSEIEKIVIALSGDVGFWSGARKLLDLLRGWADVRLVCGISSVAYFMSRIGLSWDDAKIVSAHGKQANLVSLIRQYPKVFAILGTSDGIRTLARKLEAYRMGDVLLHVGERLSYEDEVIFSAPARELADYEGDALCVVCAENPAAQALPVTHGIRDEEFLRGKAPMTKEEVRTVSLSRLRLSEDSLCYDVGAGTGSVSVEMALRASQGKVYAIEKKEEAVTLLQKNKEKFAADNLEIVEGTAPEAMEPLPAPTHAFIGGSSGNLREILAMLLEKNPSVRIVINCITLETVSEALCAVREFAFDEEDVVQLCVSRSKNVGRYHMMMGENPIYIITCQRKEV